MSRLKRRLHKRRRVLQGIGIATLGWLIIAVAVWIWPPIWPSGRPIILSIEDKPTVVGHISAFEAWRQQLAIMLVSYFLYLKSWLMFRRSRFYDRLGVSVIAVNLMFAILYELSVAFALWPVLQTHRWARELLIDTLLVFVVWGTFELMRTEDEPEGATA